ncbi:helix-turn-helix domain-containing protein [Halobacteriovorax sp. DPLXC-1]|uniref:helix-turn-helix domain-containing protein n=1 Tax=Halobacteriovorax sp. DPLXC-1 TaxID=3110771 RepID=UPI002FF1AAE8
MKGDFRAAFPKPTSCAISSDTESIEELMSVNDVASFLNVSKGYVYQLCRKGLIPNYKRLGKLYFLRNELVRWVRYGEV